jgi:hypothetical protein
MLGQDRLVSSNCLLEQPNIVLRGLDPWAAKTTLRGLRPTGVERLKLRSKPRNDHFLKISNICGPVAQTSTPNMKGIGLKAWRALLIDRTSCSIGAAIEAGPTTRRRPRNSRSYIAYDEHSRHSSVIGVHVTAIDLGAGVRTGEAPSGAELRTVLKQELHDVAQVQGQQLIRQLKDLILAARIQS